MELSKTIMLRCGILEEYWDKDFSDFYGHPKKRAEMEPMVVRWNANHPDLRIDLDFDKGKEILDDVLFYAENLFNARKHGISLFLWGPNGSGKTLLGACVLKKAISLGFSAQMTSLGGIIECYTDGWTNPERREVFNDRIKNVDFLLIDDVGKEYRTKKSDLIEVAFDNLIRYRSFRHKPFILTTNTDLTRLQSTYGKSLASLLLGKCHNIHVDGIDYRILIQAKDVKNLLRGMR